MFANVAQIVAQFKRNWSQELEACERLQSRWEIGSNGIAGTKGG